MPLVDAHHSPLARGPACAEALEGRMLLSATTAAIRKASASVARASSVTTPAVLAAPAARDKSALIGKAGSALASLAGEYADFRASGRPGGRFRASDPLLNVSN